MENQQLETRTTTIKQFFDGDNVKKKFEELMGKNSQGFITSVLQVVSSNVLLQKADPVSVYQAAAMAAVLKLPINNNLGYAYIVPYNQTITDDQGNRKSVSVAQFQMGYKGFIQLAQRTGLYKSLAVTPVREVQITSIDPLRGYTFDFSVNQEGKIIGYASYFALVNGFEKTLYMSVAELTSHGKRFSQTFKKGYGLWKDDFEAMARKTVLKQLLSTFAPMSIEVQTATISDQSLIKNADTAGGIEDVEVEYVDNTNDEPASNDTRQATSDNAAKAFTDDAK